MLIWARREADDDMTATDRVSKDLVMVGQVFEPGDEGIVGANSEPRHVGFVGANSRKGIDQARGARAIRVDKQDVERYRRCAKLIEAVDKFGEEGPRPRPLAETFEAVVIDIDDAYRGWLVFTRLQAKVFVKDEKSQLDK